ncbi:type II methionyl aminopeptidase [Candidatus Pacearchaeota archaeon]|nr:type II methionyl aminopeptidase [Candidatus Pacearchaeota archaeon]
MNTQKIIQAGKIAKQVREFIEPLIKKDMPLLDIAKKIEDKIKELGGEPAFPTNLSINNIAAHYTPSHDDKTLAHGLLKVDFGVHVDGWVADTAFSIDLENNEENKKLIQASKDALDNAIKLIKDNYSQGHSGENSVQKGGALKPTTSEIGKTIQETIESAGFSPVINLSGHEIKQYELHAGLTIPNMDNKKNILLKEGLYAIEPFTTTGNGKVHDGSPSGIYMLVDEKTPRSQTAREVLNFIIEKYSTLPFCSRWIVKELGIKSLFGLKQLEDNGNLHNFPQLVEIQGSKVAQTEHTILIEKGEVIVTTE